MTELFEYHVARIVADTSQIESYTRLLNRVHKGDLVSPEYDLRASARRLREAADKLEAICNRSTQHAV